MPGGSFHFENTLAGLRRRANTTEGTDEDRINIR